MLIGIPRLLANLPNSSMTRTVWHSEADRKLYGRVIEEYGNAWLEAEQISVLEGIRDLCLQPLSQAEYLAFLPWAHDNGLHVRVKRFAAAFNGFSHQYLPGDEMLVVAMSRNKDMVESLEPEQFLGYPECCKKFFAENFSKYIDPVLQWANYEDSVTSSSACNPVLRAIGLRRASHIPCSGHCTQTVVLAEHLSDLLPNELVEPATDILTSPTSWDCYRGIAIVKTKWFRVIYRSVPYAERVVIKINE